MSVLQKGKSIYPFWGASINLITGLDPLSLQTTSEATYSTLLPGISNLTNRLRYYGFYCWLLDFYFKRERKVNSLEQYKFIRRAELMIAIIMQTEKSEVQQIAGSNFAVNLINNQIGKYYDLAAGADKTENNLEVYWKHSSGAFGQYYYGAMKALSLVISAANSDGDIIYNITLPDARQKVSGKELADAFELKLDNLIKEVFYNNIKKGRLQFSDISDLIKYFSIDKINPKSSEWQLYVSMLLDKDEPAQEIEEQFTYNRRETIRELIHTAIENKNEYAWYELLLKAYKLKIGSESLRSPETLMGWYAYQFNEYYQYGCGAIFWSTLQYLYNFQQAQYLPAFVSKLAKAITKNLCEDLGNATSDTLLGEILKNFTVQKDEESLYKSIETKSSSDPIEAAKNGFLLLFKLYSSNKESLHELKEFMSRNHMIREGNMIDGLLYLDLAANDKLEEFIEHFLLRKIIYRHQMVAIRKMGNGILSSHKFTIEEQYIKFIDTFPPRSTSPRMNALYNLLSDLNIVTPDRMLTPLHQKLLQD